ncbi:hypothetical protein [Shimia aestuarii]|nr:hypothetical protein [Shimia aestuarii]
MPLLRCRLCARGRYETELRTPKDRRLLAAIKLRQRLGQSQGGIVVPFPPKPKWMRWHTYHRIKAEALKNERRIWESSIIESGEDLQIDKTT